MFFLLIFKIQTHSSFDTFFPRRLFGYSKIQIINSTNYGTIFFTTGIYLISFTNIKEIKYVIIMKIVLQIILVLSKLPPQNL